MKPTYIGQFQHTIDAQNRVAIPKEWRGDESEPAVYYLLPADPQMIRVVTEETFEEKIRKPIEQNVNVADDLNMMALTKLGGLTSRAQRDRQGRIVLPEPLLEHAGLNGKALLVGAFMMFHICAPEAWNGISNKQERGMVKDILGSMAAPVGVSG